jgi:hypothetical protein
MIGVGVTVITALAAVAADICLVTIGGMLERNCSDDLPDCAELNALPSYFRAI